MGESGAAQSNQSAGVMRLHFHLSVKGDSRAAGRLPEFPALLEHLQKSHIFVVLPVTCIVPKESYCYTPLTLKPQQIHLIFLRNIGKNLMS